MVLSENMTPKISVVNCHDVHLFDGHALGHPLFLNRKRPIRFVQNRPQASSTTTILQLRLSKVFDVENTPHRKDPDHTLVRPQARYVEWIHMNSDAG
jgi:hypothetical protein